MPRTATPSPVSYTHLDVYKRQMFMGVDEPPAVGDTVALTLTFENAGEITIDVPVRAE